MVSSNGGSERASAPSGGSIFSTWPQALFAVCEIFDPATETWTRTTDLQVPRVHFEMAALPNGEVLAFGGHPAGMSPQELLPDDHSELFDPATGTWSLAAPMLLNRWALDGLTAVLPSGKVLVAGGQHGNHDDLDTWQRTASVELFDPADGRWHEGPALRAGRDWQALVVLSYGRVMAVGGAGYGHEETEYWTP